MAITNTPQSTCAVSVIIPLYNFENYIANGLGSILAQTFQDYEVILVNDCSTDNSRQIAESYLEKFGGRLKIYDNEKNSGVSATRNNGLRRAVGEYVFFMDADDMLAENGLEIMYSLAKKFNADVVNFTQSSKMSEDGKTISIGRENNSIVPKNTVLIEENVAWRARCLSKKIFSTTVFRKMLRRKFLVENNLFFLENIRFAEDQIWSTGVFLLAKRIVHVPKLVPYYRRMSKGSICRTKVDIFQGIIRWIFPLIAGIKWVDNIMNKMVFFRKNPRLHYIVLTSLSERYFGNIFKNALKLRRREIYNAVRQAFGKNLGEYDVLISELITFVNTQQKRIAKLEEQLKAK